MTLLQLIRYEKTNTFAKLTLFANQSRLWAKNSYRIAWTPRKLVFVYKEILNKFYNPNMVKIYHRWDSIVYLIKRAFSKNSHIDYKYSRVAQRIISAFYA